MVRPKIAPKKDIKPLFRQKTKYQNDKESALNMMCLATFGQPRSHAIKEGDIIIKAMELINRLQEGQERMATRLRESNDHHAEEIEKLKQQMPSGGVSLQNDRNISSTVDQYRIKDLEDQVKQKEDTLQAMKRENDVLKARFVEEKALITSENENFLKTIQELRNELQTRNAQMELMATEQRKMKQTAEKKQQKLEKQIAAEKQKTSKMQQGSQWHSQYQFNQNMQRQMAQQMAAVPQNMKMAQMQQGAQCYQFNQNMPMAAAPQNQTTVQMQQGSQGQSQYSQFNQNMPMNNGNYMNTQNVNVNNYNFGSQMINYNSGNYFQQNQMAAYSNSQPSASHGNQGNLVGGYGAPSLVPTMPQTPYTPQAHQVPADYMDVVRIEEVTSSPPEYSYGNQSTQVKDYHPYNVEHQQQQSQAYDCYGSGRQIQKPMGTDSHMFYQLDDDIQIDLAPYVSQHAPFPSVSGTEAEDILKAIELPKPKKTIKIEVPDE